MKLVTRLWMSRKGWLGPLAMAFLIIAGMFIVARGPIDMPFIYRQAK
jgi:hypothetical protein